MTIENNFSNGFIVISIFQCVQDDPLRHGPLAVIASILKHSAREDVKPYSQMLLDNMLKLRLNNNPADLIRKFGIKVVQRIGISTVNFIDVIITPSHICTYAHVCTVYSSVYIL